MVLHLTHGLFASQSSGGSQPKGVMAAKSRERISAAISPPPVRKSGAGGSLTPSDSLATRYFQGGHSLDARFLDLRISPQDILPRDWMVLVDLLVFA